MSGENALFARRAGENNRHQQQSFYRQEYKGMQAESE